MSRDSQGVPTDLLWSKNITLFTGVPTDLLRSKNVTWFTVVPTDLLRSKIVKWFNWPPSTQRRHVIHRGPNWPFRYLDLTIQEIYISDFESWFFICKRLKHYYGSEDGRCHQINKGSWYLDVLMAVSMIFTHRCLPISQSYQQSNSGWRCLKVLTPPGWRLRRLGDSWELPAWASNVEL